MESKWIVQRVEEHGELTRTVELDEQVASSTYANWCDMKRRFNDQSVSLIRVDRTEVVVSRHINTEFKQV